MKQFLRRLQNTVYPPNVTCLCCGEGSGGHPLCDLCCKEMDTRRLDEEAEDGTWSTWEHRDVPRQLVLLLKHKGMIQAADVLAAGMMDTIQLMDLPQNMVVTWVTMPEKRRKKRGIDHGRALASAVAQRMHVPCLQLLLRREPSRHTQEGLHREARLRNLEGVFDAIPLNGENVLLVDDVHTTGATALFCTRALLARGARSVWVLTATSAKENKQEDNKGS